jgi:hypothetical protein
MASSFQDPCFRVRPKIGFRGRFGTPALAFKSRRIGKNQKPKIKNKERSAGHARRHYVGRREQKGIRS